MKINSKGNLIKEKLFSPYMTSFTAIIKKGEKQFVALCPEVDVVSQGFTIEEALKNLKLVEAARAEAQAIVAEDEALKKYPRLKERVEEIGSVAHFE